MTHDERLIELGLRPKYANQTERDLFIYKGLAEALAIGILNDPR